MIEGDELLLYEERLDLPLGREESMGEYKGFIQNDKFRVKRAQDCDSQHSTAQGGTDVGSREVLLMPL